jgi:hypothetical protein
VLLFRYLTLLERRNALALDSTCFQLFLELVNIADSGKEVRLSSTVTIKGCKPLAPLFLGRFGLFEVTNDRKLHGRKKAVIGNLVVLPTIHRTRNVIVGLSFEPGAIVQIEARAFDVVELKGILFKDTTDTTCLDPQQGGKEEVEGASGNANQRRALFGVCCIVSKNDRNQARSRLD